MKLWRILTVTLSLSFAAGLTVAAAGPAAAQDKDKEVTVTGCLIKANDDDDALLVTTLARVDAPPYTVDGRAADRPAPSFMRIVYWIDDDDEVEGHHGRLVEVRGEIEGDIDRGEIKVEREDDRVDVEFKADDKRLKARLPQMSAPVGTSGGTDHDERAYDVVVRKLDVKNVRMIAATCDGSVR